VHSQEELEADKEDLKSRLLDMDAAVTQANDTGKADFIMRTEIEHLKQDLYAFDSHVTNVKSSVPN
jgi:protein HOOK3